MLDKIRHKGIRPVLLSIALLLMLAGMLDYFHRQRAIWDLERSIRSIDMMLMEYDEGQMALRMSDMEKAREERSRQAESILASLPGSLAVSDIIMLLSDLGKDRITRSSLAFYEEEALEACERIKARFVFQTDYPGLLRVLVELDQLPVHVTIEHMQVYLEGRNQSDPFGAILASSGSMMYNVHVVMHLNFYIRPKLDEDAVKAR